MENPIEILRQRVAKAEAKEARAEKALAAAQAERCDLQTALRVMESIAGEATGEGAPATDSVGNRQAQILKLLREGADSGRAPADLFAPYKAATQDEINIETFRTSIWRMKDKQFRDGGQTVWVRGNNGIYWKEADVPDDIKELMGATSPAKEIKASDAATSEASESEWDVEDVPF